MKINPNIKLIAKILKQEGFDVELEYKFLNDRKFRFDLAIPKNKIAIEYEGIYQCKSRHITIQGFVKDIEKYNLALLHGWKVYRLTANDFKRDKIPDIITIVKILQELDAINYYKSKTNLENKNKKDD